MVSTATPRMIQKDGQEQDKYGAYVVSIPSLNGCRPYGLTLDEAMGTSPRLHGSTLKPYLNRVAAHPCARGFATSQNMLISLTIRASPNHACLIRIHPMKTVARQRPRSNPIGRAYPSRSFDWPTSRT